MLKEVIVQRDVFRAYDIRGIISDTFDENSYYTIGRALACYLKQSNRHHILLARDGRLTSEKLADALAQGFLDSGVDVWDLGLVSTPVLYYATHILAYDSGVMVTGSHNPKEYNGIKIVLGGKTFLQSDMDALYARMCEGHYINGHGALTSYDILSHYKNRIINAIYLLRPFKVVIDCGNGAAGHIVPDVIRSLGCDVIPVHCEVDGHFPNHHPDPSVEENLADLKEMIKIHNADLGFAFDGDGDRLGVVTKEGKVLWPDRLMMFFAKHILQNNPGATIVYDVKCSSYLSEMITMHGGIPRMCPTGHSIVKGFMKTCQAAMAGEMSGHIFFQDGWYGFDDALYAAARFLEMLSHSRRSIDAQFSDIPDSFNTPEIKIPLDDALKFEFMEKFCKEATFDNATCITIDGLRVEYKEGWGLIRASNTTPCLVARFEADSEENLLWIKQCFKRQLLKIDETLAIPF